MRTAAHAEQVRADLAEHLHAIADHLADLAACTTGPDERWPAVSPWSSDADSEAFQTAVEEDRSTFGVLDRLNEHTGNLAATRTYAVRIARAEGHSWSAIGRALGMTRQAAWEAYRHLEG